MARSYVRTNRRRLDAFFKEGRKIDDLVLRVGQLTGKPKYPRGHVGSRSRGPKREPTARIDRLEAQRRKLIRAGRKRLQGIKDPQARKLETKRLRGLIRQFADEQGIKMSTRGLGRKITAGTPVARVAGVLASRSGYHIFAIQARRGQVVRELDSIRDALLGRGFVTSSLKRMGKNSKEAVRQRFRATRHTDTGRLMRNIQYEIVDQATKKRRQAEARAARAAARAAKKARR
jgi:hypothetical protein